jgi:hypothetical protein
MRMPVWRLVEPMPTRHMSCSHCKVKVHAWQPESTLWACGDRTGPKGVRLCRRCVRHDFEVVERKHPDRRGLLRCRGCGRKSERAYWINGRNRLCAECIGLLRAGCGAR